METEIFFTSSDVGQSWYVWARSAAQAYFFTSLENAERFARAVSTSEACGALQCPHTCLEQQATLI